MQQLDQAVLDELEEVAPATAAVIAEGIGEDLRSVRRALGRLETAGLVDADEYGRQPGAAKWGLKGWGENA